MTIFYIRRVHDLDADKANFNIQGIRGTASVLTTTNIDWALPQERWISGGILLASGTHWGDKISLQLIDIDNVLGYGANTVLGEYVTDFYVVTDSQLQCQLEAPYVALVPAGVYVRIKYTNTSALDPVEVALNLITHVPKA